MFANESKGERWPNAGIDVTGGSSDYPNKRMNQYWLWADVYPEYCTDFNVILCPSAGRYTLYKSTDLGSARNAMAGCDQTAADYANNTPDDEFPCYGKTGVDPSDPLIVPGVSSHPARAYNGCDVHPEHCAPQPHTDLATIGWTDVRAYRYYNYLIPSNLMNTTLDNYYAIGRLFGTSTIAATDMENLNVGAESFTRWKNRAGGQTYQLPGGQSVTMHRLREGIERFTITDINNPAGSANAQSDIVVMLDESRAYSAGGGGVDSSARFNHVPGGANLLYMDGHVEFAKHPTSGGHQWPMNQFSYHIPDWANPPGKLDFP
jgi:prepilin-type processing-associated H-X9-DG protein